MSRICQTGPELRDHASQSRHLGNFRNFGLSLIVRVFVRDDDRLWIVPGGPSTELLESFPAVFANPSSLS